VVHGIIGNPGEFGSTDCAGVTQLAHLLTPVIKPPSATSENQRAFDHGSRATYGIRAEPKGLLSR